MICNENHQGNILAIKLEYSSEEEVKQITGKKKDNKDNTSKNQQQITNFFMKK